jgi:globin
MSLNLEALETSFDLVAPRGDELMDEFYSRLFAAAPAVKPLFPKDMRRQKTMLLGALVLLRKSLRDLDAIVPKLRELGARHVAYGAQPEHYPVVGTGSSRRWLRSQVTPGPASSRSRGARLSRSSPRPCSRVRPKLSSRLPPESQPQSIGASLPSLATYLATTALGTPGMERWSRT